MVMSMSEQTTVDKYTLEGEKDEAKGGKLMCNSVMSRKAGSIQEGGVRQGRLSQTQYSL